MKATQFALVAGICLLIVMGRPSLWEQHKESAPVQERQEEQEVLYDEDIDPASNGTTLEISYQIKNKQEESIADIVWLKEAAQAALDNGTPYFYVIDQRVTKKFIRNQNTELSFIEGTIELETDPMAAEYDANEIMSLVLTDN